MFTPNQIYRAPPGSDRVFLGQTLPSLLDAAIQHHPNEQALNQWQWGRWQSWSLTAFRNAFEELALGLQALGLVEGDRIALLMHSDVDFCIADMGSLLAHLINVPLYMGETPENVVFILQHSEAKALVVSDAKVLRQISPCLQELDHLQFIIVAGDGIPEIDHPENLRVISVTELQSQGAALLTDQARQNLRSAIQPHDIATIVYVVGATGQCQSVRSQMLPIFSVMSALQKRIGAHYVCEQPKGVMLTHENLTGDALAAFHAMPGLKTGAQETVLSFLPLTHVFARVMLYGHLGYGHTVYFTTPKRVVKHLREIQPTVLSAVPRFLEKVYQKIQEQGHQMPRFKQMMLKWAIALAQQYELGERPGWLYGMELKLADTLVYHQWRDAFGDRIRYLLCGGAALKAELANVFSAAGIPVLQGYGLTQTSAVLCVNRGEFNQAGTVGIPIAGVEIAIAPDSEILAKAPYVMKGYYKNPVATEEAIEPNGWFHTGDLGEVCKRGFLTITGHKKSLFKLSTGKYVAPEPIENHLMQSPLIDHAIAVGRQRPFCALLIFPSEKGLQKLARKLGVQSKIEELLLYPKIIAQYQSLVNDVNQTIPTWSKVKRFRLVDASLSVANGLLTPDRQLNRDAISLVFAGQIEAMYGMRSSRVDQQVSRSTPVSQSVPSSALTLETS